MISKHFGHNRVLLIENIVTLQLQARCIQSLAIFVQIIHVFFFYELSIDYMEWFKKKIQLHILHLQPRQLIM